MINWSFLKALIRLKDTNSAMSKFQKSQKIFSGLSDPLFRLMTSFAKIDVLWSICLKISFLVHGFKKFGVWSLFRSLATRIPEAYYFANDCQLFMFSTNKVFYC